MINQSNQGKIDRENSNLEPFVLSSNETNTNETNTIQSNNIIYIYFLPYDSVICDSITLIEKSRTEGLSVGSDRFVLLDKFVAV